MNAQQIQKASYMASLIAKRLENGLTEEETRSLDQWIGEDERNERLFLELIDEREADRYLQQFLSVDTSAALQRFRHRLALQEQEKKTKEQREEAKISFPRSGKTKIFFLATGIGRYVAAAILVVALGAIALFYGLRPGFPGNQPKLAKGSANDLIVPGSPRATLILSNGRSVLLDDKTTAALPETGGVRISTREGVLRYERTDGSTPAVVSHTVLTPRGGEFSVLLDDGTRVWLNAASSLRYPTRFTGGTREVTLTGEAYFEVAANPQKPFLVHVGATTVQAVGTAFDIKAYTEDNGIEATLTQGSIKVRHAGEEQLLHPGQVARIPVKPGKMEIGKADVGAATAWKNGLFVFRSTAIRSAMNQLARWYDVDVRYDRRVANIHFSGEISRKATLDKVLGMLEMTGGARFRTIKRTVIVIPGEDS